MLLCTRTKPLVTVADRTQETSTSDIALSTDRWLISREADRSFHDWYTCVVRRHGFCHYCVKLNI